MRYFTLLLLSCLSATAFSQEGEPPQPNSEGVYEQVEQMPLYRADCPGDYEEAKACADHAMLKYIYENIQYPGKARKKGVEGMVVVSFVIERDGTVSNASIYRDIGYGAGEEVLRLVRAMNADGPSWLPGTQDGKPVRVEFKLPVKFSLS